MARIDSLAILLSTSGNDKLAEQYGAVIENVQKECISSQLKNTALSGTPGAGTYEAKRFENRSSNAYGTARTAGAGVDAKVTPVTIAVNTDREIICEVEQKDVTLYGVDDLIQREAASAQKSMIRELERAFFYEAASQGQTFTTAETDADAIMEALIQELETTSNDFVDGVPRDMMAVVCAPATYGALRSYFDTVKDGGAHGESFGTFHGVKFYSSVYLPSGVDAIAMVEGAVAQPVLPTIAQAQRIQLSNAIAFGIFFSYGTKAVADDLIQVYGSITTTTTTGA